MLKNLNKLMERFDKSDFTEEEKDNFLKRLFGKAKKVSTHFMINILFSARKLIKFLLR